MDDKVLARLDTMEQNLRDEIRDVSSRMYSCQRDCREDVGDVKNRTLEQGVQLGNHLSSHRIWFRIGVGLLTSVLVTMLGLALARLVG
jgi:hypothetical protein